MRLPSICLTFLLFLIAGGAVHAELPDSLRSTPRSVDLNEVVFNANGLKEVRKKTRITDVSMHFGVQELGTDPAWDSTYFLTRFQSPGSKKFMLISVEGRIADFDTSKFEMFLTLLQLNGTDTFFREIPITLERGKRSKQCHVMDLRNYEIALQPSPFYLGYGFHTKPVKENFTYRLYAGTGGGEGAVLSVREGRWRLMSRNGPLSVFPFKMTYLEL